MLTAEGVLQVCLENPTWLTQVQIGAVPTNEYTKGKSKMNIFVRDVLNPKCARFICVYEGIDLPVSGSRMIPVQVSAVIRLGVQVFCCW